MKTLNTPPQTGMPASAHRPPRQQDLAVLTRANHDIRSPLSVILGVFELLEDAGSLSDGERRYLRLGMKAADELLALADGLRLYSALERSLVTLDATPVDLGAMAREQLEPALGARGFSIEPAAAAGAGVRALGDAGYLKVALTGLAGHLAANLPDQQEPFRPAMTVLERLDEQGRVALQVAPHGAAVIDEAEAAIPTASESLQHDELAVLNGVRLIELMGGSVSITPRGPSLVITLPAAERAR